jgi:hypothetical protein
MSLLRQKILRRNQPDLFQRPAGIEDLEGGDGVLDIGHEVADEGSTLVVEHIQGPGDRGMAQFSGGIIGRAQHPGQFALVDGDVRGSDIMANAWAGG